MKRPTIKCSNRPSLVETIPLSSRHARVMHTVANSNSSMSTRTQSRIRHINHYGHTELHKFGFANHFVFSCTASPAALAGCPEQYSKSRSGVSECDRVVSGPMLDQAIKRGFIAENKLNQVAEFSLVHQLSPLGGLSLTSSPPVAPSVSGNHKGVPGPHR